MSTSNTESLIQALKIAFCYMPKAIEVNRYEHGDRVESMLEEIELVRSTLVANGIDPDEVFGELRSDQTPNSSY